MPQPLRKRRCISSGPKFKHTSQSLMMEQMYERISAYDYRLEIDSNVTKCSFGSYKEICGANPALQFHLHSESSQAQSW